MQAHRWPDWERRSEKMGAQPRKILFINTAGRLFITLVLQQERDKRSDVKQLTTNK
jgi:hypothetical protein